MSNFPVSTQMSDNVSSQRNCQVMVAPAPVDAAALRRTAHTPLPPSPCRERATASDTSGSNPGRLASYQVTVQLMQDINLACTLTVKDLSVCVGSRQHRTLMIRARVLDIVSLQYFSEKNLSYSPLITTSKDSTLYKSYCSVPSLRFYCSCFCRTI